MSELSEKVLDEIRRNIPQTFEAWAPHHTDKDGVLSFRAFDPDDPYQDTGNVRIEPEPSLDIAEAFGNAAVGHEAYEKLCAGLTEFEVVKIGVKRHMQGKSTIIPTLHLWNVYDTPTTHNGIFVVSGGNPEVADINDVIASPMLAYTGIGGLAVFRVLSASGGIDLALPLRGAKKHGMIKPARKYLTERMTDNMTARLNSGVILNWALSQSRATPIWTTQGREALSVDKIDKTLAEYLVDRELLAVPIPINLQKIGDAQVEVMEPRPLDTVSDIHEMAEEMTEVASRISRIETYYGMPEGAVERTV